MSDQPNQSHEAFFRCFVKHERDLKGYARALLPTRQAAEDVMQEASVVMWRKLDQLRDESEFLPWAKVIVRFEVMKARKSAALDRLEFGEDVFEQLADDTTHPIEPEILRKERTALDSCLKKLNHCQRKLVLLPYHGHGAVTDLASDSGRSANSLYKKIARLRQKLSMCIEEELPKVSS